MSAEIAGVDELLTELTGHGATVVRPPYGSVNSSVKETVGTPMILWSIDTLDWESQDPQKIVDTTLSQVEDGSIILMHDIFSTDEKTFFAGRRFEFNQRAFLCCKKAGI